MLFPISVPVPVSATPIDGYANRTSQAVAHHTALLDGLPALEAIEFDISRWEAQGPEWILRAVLLDFRIYAPALQHVIFWIGQARINWYLTREGEWQHVRHMGRAPGSDSFWRAF